MEELPKLETETMRQSKCPSQTVENVDNKNGTIVQANDITIIDHGDKSCELVGVPCVEAGRLINRAELWDEVFEKLIKNTGKPIYFISEEGLGKSFFVKVFCNDGKCKNRYGRIIYMETVSYETDIRCELMDEISKNINCSPAFQRDPSSNIDIEWERFVEIFKQKAAPILAVFINIDSANKINMLENAFIDLSWDIIVTTNDVKILRSNRKFEIHKSRKIDFNRLELKYCQDLFIDIYCGDIPEKESSCRNNYMNEIDEIIKTLNYHTDLIRIVAEWTSINLVNPKDIRKRFKDIEMKAGQEHDYYYEKLMKNTEFTCDEIVILTVMSYVSPNQIDVNVLDEWLDEIKRIRDDLDHVDIYSILNRLKYGWVEKVTRTNIYAMSRQVKNAFYEVHGFDNILFEQFLIIFTKSIELPFLGGNCACIKPYYHHMQTIYHRFKDNRSYAMFKFIRNYVLFLLRTELNIEVLDMSKKLNDKFYSYLITSECIHQERMYAFVLYDMTDVRYSRDKGKYKQRQILAKNMLVYAEKHFDYDDFWYICAKYKHIRANTYPKNDDYSLYEKAIKDLKILVAEINKYYAKKNKTKDIDYILFEIYKAILDYTSRLFLVRKLEKLEEANETYEALSEMLCFIDDEDDYKRVVKNELCEYQLNRYNINKNPNDIKEVMTHFEKTYEWCKTRYGDDSISTANATYSLAKAYRYYGELDKIELAISMIGKSIKSLESIFDDGKSKQIWKQYWEQAMIYYCKYKLCSCSTALEKAKESIEKADKIAETITDDVKRYHIEYQALYENKEEICGVDK